MLGPRGVAASHYLFPQVSVCARMIHVGSTDQSLLFPTVSCCAKGTGHWGTCTAVMPGRPEFEPQL